MTKSFDHSLSLRLRILKPVGDGVFNVSPLLGQGDEESLAKQCKTAPLILP